MKLSTVVFLLLLSICACNRRPSAAQLSQTTVSPSAAAGWLDYSNTALGFRLAFPASWKQIDLGSEKIDAGVKSVSRDPSVAQSLIAFARERAASGVSFLAIDSGGAAIAQLSWKQADKNSPINLDSLATIWTNNAGSNGNRLIGSPLHTHAEFPIGEAQEVRYSTEESTTIQYLIGHENDIYILTFSTNPVNAARYDSVFARIGRSMQSSR